MYAIKGVLTIPASEGKTTIIYTPHVWYQFEIQDKARIVLTGGRSIPTGTTLNDLEILSDDWFVNPFLEGLKGGDYFHFSKKGWEANKTLIQEAFEKSEDSENKGTWEEFLAHVKMFFDKFDESRLIKIKVNGRVARLESYS